MAENTNIEWADHTFNPWIGCTKVGPGCDNCYAKAEWDDRRHRVVWGAGQARSRTKTWGDPVKWNKREFFQCESCGTRGEGVQWEDFNAASGGKLDDGYECAACGSRSMEPVRRQVFCASLADVFDNEVPPQWRADLFSLIVATPSLDWLLLTKRIGNVRAMLDNVSYQGSADSMLDKMPLPNVWIGATICNQEEADRDIPKLLTVPAAKRFLSMEPLLAPVDIMAHLVHEYDGRPGSGEVCSVCGVLTNGKHHPYAIGVDWVIVGGESGPKARPIHPDWARSLRDQCQAAGVPFMFKQWGEWLPGHHYTPELQDLDNNPEQSRYPCAQWDGKWHVGHICGGEQWDDGALWRVGKKAAGRHLDGRTWDEVPA